MAIVAHKYITEQMPENEFRATFAARHHTVDYLVEELRRQIPATTLSSYLLSGPRGSGKSTVLRMLRLHIHDDAELCKAWLPVVFPEEQFNVASLRDLFAGALQMLTENGIDAGAAWLEKVEAERDDEQSEELAIAGLKEIARLQGKRLILFIENLDQFFEDAVTDRMKGTLRRMLMTDPFMLIIGSAVHVFESLRKYDEAFFNYFCRVPLGRLTEQEVFEVLTKRAQFDGNQAFLQALPGQRAHIAAIAHLSGGNPRLIMLLYELISERQVTTIVQQLRRLVDELTPLLKHELEILPAQQQKIIHSLMEQGGTATPSALAGPTRLSLNAVTQQLRRLKESQILEMHGGGKGRAAHYTVPDKLFSIWYQMRYLSTRRRQIEVFVDVLRVWFDVEERLRVLRDLATATCPAAATYRANAVTAEYFAASLSGTPHEQDARDLALRQWLRANDVHEAAFAYAEFTRLKATDDRTYEMRAFTGFGDWVLENQDPKAAVQVLKSVAEDSNDPNLLIRFGLALAWSGDHQQAISTFNKVLSTEAKVGQMAVALVCRGVAKRWQGDYVGAIADYTAVVELPQAPVDQVALALGSRGVAKVQQGDYAGAITDYTAIVDLPHASVGEVVSALGTRGATRWVQGDHAGAIADFNTIIELPDAPVEKVALALVSRGTIKGTLGQSAEALRDLDEALKLPGIHGAERAFALLNRGLVYMALEKTDAAFQNWLDVLAIENAPVKIEEDAADAGYRLACRLNKVEMAITVLRKFREVLASLPIAQRTEVLVRWLAELAAPEMKSQWPQACRTLLENQPPELTEALRAFSGVSDVLESNDPSLLDSLPPEQRDFALKILERFEPPRSTGESAVEAKC